MKTHHTSLIERFFDKELSKEELIQVEELKKTDVAFQNEFALFEKAQMVIELNALSELKEDVRQIDKSQTKTTSKLSFGWMRIAASVVLIAMVGSLFYVQTQYSNTGLYEDNYNPAKDYVSDLSSEKSMMNAAMQFYNKNQFTEAIDAFVAIENQNPLNQAAKFYLGQSFLQDNQADQAITTLNEVSGEYRPEAQWYLVLAYLKTGNESSATKTLDNIIQSNTDSLFVKKAKRLKNKLTSPLRKLLF